MGILTVFLDKIDNLADEDMVGKSDPYVKFELEQDNMVFDKDFGEQKSSKKKIIKIQPITKNFILIFQPLTTWY